jgi:repressor LexA
MKAIQPLTPTQEKVLEFIYDRVRNENIAPTHKEICAHMGYKSPNSSNQVMRALVRKGRIKIKPGTHRGILIDL